MKTKLYSMEDWKAVLKEIGWEDAPTMEQIEKETIQELTRGKVTFAEQPAQTPIEKTCRVTLRTQSVLPKFNREKTVITVGSGLYDPTVEAALCGMTTGQTGEVTVKGETVSFDILKVEKKQYPALTDELVADLQIEGVFGLQSYRRYMEQRIKTEYAGKLANALLEKLAASAQFGPYSDEDISAVITREYEPLQARFSLDKMTPEEWKEGFGNTALREFYAQIYPDVALLFGTTGKESFFASRREAAEKTIRNCLLLGAMVGREADPTEDSKAEKNLMQKLESKLLEEIYGG